MKGGRRYEAGGHLCGKEKHEPAVTYCCLASADFLGEPAAMSVIPAGYKQTQVGVIPEDWSAVPLSVLGHFKNGINKGNEAFGHGSPFVNLMDVFGVSSIVSGEALGLVDTSGIEQKTYDLKCGDVIFIRSSVKPSGVGLTAVVEADLPQTVYSGFLIRFRDGGFLDIGFKRQDVYKRQQRWRSWTRNTAARRAC